MRAGREAALGEEGPVVHERGALCPVVSTGILSVERYREMRGSGGGLGEMQVCGRGLGVT